MLADIFITVLQFVSMFYLTVVLLRFMLQLARADFYNPISQFVVKATNAPLRPLRKVIPGIGGVDGASLVLAVLVSALFFTLLWVASGFPITGLNPIALLAWSGVHVLDLILNIYFWSVLAVVIISWVAPQSDHPAIALVAQITEPVMRPVRNIVPPLGGLDLSPIFVFLILSVLRQVVDHLGRAVGMPV